MGRKKRALFRKIHKWPALAVSLFIILWAVSGIVLNHRVIFSSFDVNRSLLPAEHHYRNWNNAALKGTLSLDRYRSLFYGNIGVYEYNYKDNEFISLNAGFPEGTDPLKINCLLKTPRGRLFAGSRYGLYEFDSLAQTWIRINKPGSSDHIVDMICIDDSIYLLSRSELWTFSLAGNNFQQRSIPAPENYDGKVSLFKTLWMIHSGEIYGLSGKLLVDLVAVIFIFLTLSGLVYFFFPRIIRQRKRRSRKIAKLIYWNRWSVKWHNKIGVWLALILILTAVTGMFLRPPLLIAIAQSRIGKISYSVLDNPNPWYDQLRRILYDKEKDLVFLATSEGIYLTNKAFSNPLIKAMPQPPASVMGYNVFERYSEGMILVGSFSGLYLWDPESGLIIDHISGMPVQIKPGPSMPLSENMVSGYIVDTAGREYMMDYNRGVIPVRHNVDFPLMSPAIRNTAMPLWNVALELHTGRLFKPFLGDFYILFIPLFGLTTLMILLSGIVLWLRKYRKHKK